VAADDRVVDAKLQRGLADTAKAARGFECAQGREGRDHILLQDRIPPK
jgi:hypothetical protein